MSNSYTYAEFMGQLANLAKAVNRILETNIIGSDCNTKEPTFQLHDEAQQKYFRESQAITEASKAAEAYFRQAEKDMTPPTYWISVVDPGET